MYRQKKTKAPSSSPKAKIKIKLEGRAALNFLKKAANAPNTN